MKPRDALDATQRLPGYILLIFPIVFYLVDDSIPTQSCRTNKGISYGSAFLCFSRSKTLIPLTNLAAFNLIGN